MRKATMTAAVEHAIAEYPRESCGLVVSANRKERYVSCENIHATPEKDFTISGEDYYAAEKSGTITTLVHSHPDGNSVPSEADKVMCENSGLRWCILAVHGDPSTPKAAPRLASNSLIEPTGYSLPLEGREFSFGVVDCYTLVQDFYKREMDIYLPDFDREDKFWERGEDLYMDNLYKSGFEKIDQLSQKGDLILMSIRSDIVNHAAVWLGHMDHIIHHPYNHLSEKTVYGGYWLENQRLYARMKK